MRREWRSLITEVGDRGDAPAIVEAAKVVSASELVERVKQLSNKLHAVGVHAGSRVAIIAENSLEYLVTYLALLQSEAVPILISPRFPDELLDSLVAETDATFTFLTTDTTAQMKPQCDAQQLRLGVKTTPPVTPQGDTPTAQTGVIIFTSGTSRLPRAAQLSLRALIRNAQGANGFLPFLAGDRWLLSLPLYHVGGLGILFRALVTGGMLVIPEKGESIAVSIERYQCTHLSLVPTQLRRLCREMPAGFSSRSLKAILVGGAQLPELLAEEAIQRKLPLYVTYGLTEMGSQVCTRKLSREFSAVQNAGNPLDGRETMVDSEGVIRVRGETLFDGYYERGGTLTTARDAEGWFRTDDLGRLEADGSLVVLGRADNCLISGGENIHAEEIERVLLAVEGIESAVVVPVPHEEYGERPVAFLRWDSPPAMDRVLAELRRSLPGFKHPDHFFDWPADILMTGIKPPRSRLRARACELLQKG